MELTDTVTETAQSILELATNAKSLWLSKNPQERMLDLNDVLSNPRLDGKTVRYEMRKPFAVLAKMAKSEDWWALLDLNQRPEDYESPALTN